MPDHVQSKEVVLEVYVPWRLSLCKKSKTLIDYFQLLLIYLFWIIFNMAIYPSPNKGNTCKSTEIWKWLAAPSHIKPKLVVSDAIFPWWLPSWKNCKILIDAVQIYWWSKNIKKSCNLIGWQYFHLSFTNQNFPTYVVFAESYNTTGTFILNQFQPNIMK